MNRETLFDRANTDETGLHDTFDWMADRYVDQTVTVSRGRYPGWMIEVAEVVAQFNPKSIADVCCGPGYLLYRLQERMPEADLVGVDYSSRMLEKAPTSIRTEHRELMEWARQSDRRFDVIVMTFVLRDQPDPKAVLKALRGRLDGQGHLVVLETQTPKGWRKPGFHTYFHYWLPWWGERVLASDWPGPSKTAPYRWLSDSHRVWERKRLIPDAFDHLGYKEIKRYRPQSDVVMVWSAQRG